MRLLFKTLAATIQGNILTMPTSGCELPELFLVCSGGGLASRVGVPGGAWPGYEGGGSIGT